MRRVIHSIARGITGDEGGVLVLVALSSAALLAFSALAIDIGMLVTARSEAQRSADALALAGASAYLEYDPATDPVNAEAEGRKRVMEYALQNAVRGTTIDTATEVQDTFMLSEYKVRVTVSRKSIPLWFARIFGVDDWDVAASATAIAALAGSTDCVKPFMIPDMWEEGNGSPGQGDDAVRPNGIWDFDKDLGCNGNSCAPEVWQINDTDTYTRPTITDGQISAPGTGYGSNVRNQMALDSIRTYMPNCGDQTLAPGCTPGTGNKPQTWTDPTSTDCPIGITNCVKYNGDNGRRIPLKVQNATGGNVQSFWYPWVIPGAANSGYAAVVDEIGKCVPLDQIAVGDVVNVDGSAAEGSLDAETKNGLGPMPIYKAIKDLVAQDPDLYWDESAGHPRYPGADVNDTGWEKSPRVFTVVIFDPTSLRQGKQEYPVVNFGRFFLENPDQLYPDITPAHQRPITGRLIKFARGSSGPQKGTLVRTLRLVK